jgi:hypothetical protein
VNQRVRYGDWPRARARGDAVLDEIDGPVVTADQLRDHEVVHPRPRGVPLVALGKGGALDAVDVEDPAQGDVDQDRPGLEVGEHLRAGEDARHA